MVSPVTFYFFLISFNNINRILASLQLQISVGRPSFKSLSSLFHLLTVTFYRTTKLKINGVISTGAAVLSECQMALRFKCAPHFIRHRAASTNSLICPVTLSRVTFNRNLLKINFYSKRKRLDSLSVKSVHLHSCTAREQDGMFLLLQLGRNKAVRVMVGEHERRTETYGDPLQID